MAKPLELYLTKSKKKESPKSKRWYTLRGDVSCGLRVCFHARNHLETLTFFCAFHYFGEKQKQRQLFSFCSNLFSSQNLHSEVLPAALNISCTTPEKRKHAIQIFPRLGSALRLLTCSCSKDLLSV